MWIKVQAKTNALISPTTAMRYTVKYFFFSIVLPLSALKTLLSIRLI